MKKVFKWILSIGLAVTMCFGATVIASSSTEAVIADAAESYYSGITATSGNALLGQVHDLITTTHTNYTSYADCKNPTYVKQTDPGSSSAYVMEFYSQADISSTWGSGAVGTWNREHVWCQSLSNSLWGETGGGSDMHHIRPVETRLNSTRGNNKYGLVNNRDNYKAYYKDGSGNNVAHGGYNSGGIFEPLDNVKGDVARIVMYMYTHYNKASNVNGSTNGNGASGYFGTLNFTHIISASSESAAISLLLKWHNSDPVDKIEQLRNDVVYSIQGNRNPFIDNPAYADAIWGDGTVIPDNPTVELTGLSIDLPSIILAEGKSQKLTAIPTPSNAPAGVTWTSADESVATVSASGLVTAKSAGTTTITATSTDKPSITATAQVTVKKSDYTVATITLESFNLTTGYSFKTWSAGGLSGIGYIYGGNSAYPPEKGMQFNKNQASYYLASTTAASGPIKSVTVVANSGNTADRDWKLLTSDTPYTEVAVKPTNGNDQGTKTVTTSGVTWTLSGEDIYFALTYEAPTGTTSAAAYLDSIIVEYGGGAAEGHVCGHICGTCNKCTDVACKDPVCADKCTGHNGNNGNTDEDPVVDSAKLNKFYTAVDNIVTNGSLQTRLNSINNAIKAYKVLSEAEKSSAAAYVKRLQDAIDDYNRTVKSYNDDAQTANKGAYGG